MNTGVRTAIVLLLPLMHQVFAVDGISVTWACRHTEHNWDLVPERVIYTNWGAEYCPGKIIKLTVENSSVTSCDTIYKSTFARFPVLNIDGNRIAFQRWGARIDNGALVDSDLPLHLAVMDIDGNNVRDLVEIDDQMILLDWARENGADWIYYTTGPWGGEVWKVNPDDPSSKALAFSYKNDRADGFHRWDIAADGSRAMIFYHFLDGGYTNVPHALPFTTPPLPGGQGGTADDMISCNGTMSPSGKYIATFMAFGHGASTIARWDPGNFLWGNDYVMPRLTEMSESLGVYVGANMEIQRWSSNSDKWMCLGATGSYQSFADGGNQILSNWVDKEFIMTTSNAYENVQEVPIVYYCEMGDFWVAGGPQGCYEDSAGEWISVETGETVSADYGIPAQGIGLRPEVRLDGDRLTYSSPGAAVTSVTILDTRGRTVYRVEPCGEAVVIPVGHLGAQSLIVRIETGGRTIVQRVCGTSRTGKESRAR